MRNEKVERQLVDYFCFCLNGSFAFAVSMLFKKIPGLMRNKELESGKATC